jgi:hypothetical protein
MLIGDLVLIGHVVLFSSAKAACLLHQIRISEATKGPPL